MVELVGYEEDFLKMYNREPRKIVAYGAGKCLFNNYMKIPHIDCICDKNADKLNCEIGGIRVSRPEKILEYKEQIYIVVFVYNQSMFWEICEQLKGYDICAKIVSFNNNVAFGYSYGFTHRSYQRIENGQTYSVNLVCYEKTWIYKKFADKLEEYLEKAGIKVYISRDTRQDVDINHHIPCLNYQPYPNDTLMITHIDDLKKIELLKKQLETARMGICMSKETVNKLILHGVPAKRLCYINPAQDDVITPQKYIIGITHRCYSHYDVRKRENAILDILEGVNPGYFKFVIMGAGWQDIVDSLRQRQFEVQYYDNFDHTEYRHLMDIIDYYLFIGTDEGSMGYLDALAAGVGTIVTPQGFHLDVECEIDYPCITVSQFKEAFLDLQRKREAKVRAVSEWTWKNYALKHMEIWDYILQRKDLKCLYQNQMLYNDGIFSVLLDDCRI